MMLSSVAVFSQNTRTSDSIKVAVKDMDKATEKMIEGKKFKEQLDASKAAFQACSEIKSELKGQNEILKLNLSDLKKAVANSEANNLDLKKLAENEKRAGLRRGFNGFVLGVGVSASLVAAFFLLN